MSNDSAKRKGATWKRFVAGFAIAAATTVVGAGMADAASVGPAPKVSTISNTATTCTPTPLTGGCGPTVRVMAAQSGIRW